MLLETSRPKIWSPSPTCQAHRKPIAAAQTNTPTIDQDLWITANRFLSEVVLFFDVLVKDLPTWNCFCVTGRGENIPASHKRVWVCQSLAPLASVSYLKPVSSRFLGQSSVPDKKRRGQKKLLWLKGRDQTHLSECSVWDSQLHMGSLLRRFRKGSPGSRHRTCPTARSDQLLLSADFFLHNAEVQVQTCRCIPAEGFGTFTTILAGQRCSPVPTTTTTASRPQGLCCDGWMGNCVWSGSFEDGEDLSWRNVGQWGWE